MAAKTNKAIKSKTTAKTTSNSSKATKGAKSTAKGTSKSAASKSPAKGTSKKAAPKSTAKVPSKAAASKATSKAAPKAKATSKKADLAPAAKTKTTKSNLEIEVSTKAKVKSKADERRAQAAALIEAAMEDEDEAEDDDDEEFDPEAFLAASGGKGLIRSHIMRKERVDLNLPIRYRLMRGPLVFNTILLNLSKSGLCIESKEKMKDKTVLRVEIPLPHTSELFAIQAEVIWSEKAPGSPTGKGAIYHLGMNFLPMSLAKKTVINSFIQQRRDEIVMAKIGLDRFAESVPVSGLD